MHFPAPELAKGDVPARSTSLKHPSKPCGPWPKLTIIDRRGLWRKVVTGIFMNKVVRRFALQLLLYFQ